MLPLHCRQARNALSKGLRIVAHQEVPGSQAAPMVYRRNPAPCRLVLYIRIPGLPLDFEGDSNSVGELREKIGLIDVGDDLRFVSVMQVRTPRD